MYMPRPYLYLSLPCHCTYIWPQLRTRCAGEEAVPITCVGGARPCAGRGRGRGAARRTGAFRRTPATYQAQHAPRTLLMLRDALKILCNFRPAGPFGITLRAGCAMDMDGAVGVGDTRPRAGRGAARARSAVPQRAPRQVRANQVARPCKAATEVHKYMASGRKRLRKPSSGTRRPQRQLGL
jgi:hypothetical protein